MEDGKLFFIKELDQWNSVSDTIPVVGRGKQWQSEHLFVSGPLLFRSIDTAVSWDEKLSGENC
ncbi:hypothetical protein [Desulfosporosinus sp. FKA]|uniref:hypothetical protein n=1 Tax=Desulfosporosinus sp. FKA TaxID=1969834 RepID=UPI001556B117|nr:hypothetical protein [Desulfosporosinus sp. FKA]